jgi:trk system potassium uptake protein TrkA
VEGKGVLIVGGGLVGQTLANRLSRDGYDVTLIDQDPARVREVSETLDIQIVEGDGATAPVLRNAGIENVGLVVAATESDAANVLVGFLATHVFNTPRVVVRVHDPGHEEGFVRACEDRPVEGVCVNPDSASVERIASLLEVPGAVDVMQFIEGAVFVAGFRINSASDFAGLRVSDMKLLFASTPTLAVAIQRGSDWIVPGGTEQIHAGDLVYFAIARQELADVLALVGAPPERSGRIMVAGASSIGLALAKRLEERDERVVMIEEDPVAAQVAASTLDHVLVIQGKPTDQSLLDDEEIEQVSTFVALTDDHESNLVAGLLAKRLGAGRSIVLVDNPAMVSMVGDIGIDAIISPRLLTIGETIQHIRGGGVRSGAALLGEEVEIIEVDANQDCRLTSAPLMDVGLPKGVLIAALERGDELLLPRGGDQIMVGDRLLIVTMSELSTKLNEFLEP